MSQERERRLLLWGGGLRQGKRRGRGWAKRNLKKGFPCFAKYTYGKLGRFIFLLVEGTRRKMFRTDQKKKDEETCACGKKGRRLAARRKKKGESRGGKGEGGGGVNEWGRTRVHDLRNQKRNEKRSRKRADISGKGGRCPRQGTDSSRERRETQSP